MKVVTDIPKVFGRAAPTYDRSAVVQRQAAVLLARKLAGIVDQLPDGPVLELACGTGLFTEELVRLCRERHLTISDLSKDMVLACQSRLRGCGTFVVLDAHQLSSPNTYALIVCAFGAQWFRDLRTAFDGIMQALVPGGHFLFSLPTDDSFPEWKTACERQGTEFSGNKLPSAAAINSYSLENGYASDLRATQICLVYDSSLSFFRSLRDLGATAPLPFAPRCERVPASGRQGAEPVARLRTLIKKWDGLTPGNVTVTYDVLYGALQKR